MVLSPKISVCGSALCAGALVSGSSNSSDLQIMLACPMSLFLATGLGDTFVDCIDNIVLDFKRISLILQNTSSIAFNSWIDNPLNKERYSYTNTTMYFAFLIDLYRPILDHIFDNSKITLDILCKSFDLQRPKKANLKVDQSLQASEVSRKKSRQSSKLTEAANQRGQKKLSFFTSA